MMLSIGKLKSWASSTKTVLYFNELKLKVSKNFLSKTLCVKGKFGTLLIFSINSWARAHSSSSLSKKNWLSLKGESKKELTISVIVTAFIIASSWGSAFSFGKFFIKKDIEYSLIIWFVKLFLVRLKTKLFIVWTVTFFGNLKRASFLFLELKTR